MRWAGSLAAVALLAGCGTPVPQVVRVPVPVPCVVDLPAAPAIASDTELRAMSDYRLVVVIARERLQLLGYSAELRAAAEGCLHPRLEPASSRVDNSQRGVDESPSRH